MDLEEFYTPNEVGLIYDLSCEDADCCTRHLL
jgi:hypothetical protein